MTTRVTTAAKVRICEMNGEDIAVDGKVITVETHWNQQDSVRLSVAGGSIVTVVAADLILAIQRCSR